MESSTGAKIMMKRMLAVNIEFVDPENTEFVADTLEHIGKQIRDGYLMGWDKSPEGYYTYVTNNLE